MRFEMTFRRFGRPIRREVDTHAIALFAATLATHERGVRNARWHPGRWTSTVTHDDALEIRALPLAIVRMSWMALIPDGSVLVQRIGAVSPVLANALLPASATAIAALARERRQRSRHQHGQLGRVAGTDLEDVPTVRALITRRRCRDAEGLGLSREGRSIAASWFLTAEEAECE